MPVCLRPQTSGAAPLAAAVARNEAEGVRGALAWTSRRHGLGGWAAEAPDAARPRVPPSTAVRCPVGRVIRTPATLSQQPYALRGSP